jgi:hypothetical protein
MLSSKEHSSLLLLIITAKKSFIELVPGSFELSITDFYSIVCFSWWFCYKTFYLSLTFWQNKLERLSMAS